MPTVRWRARFPALRRAPNRSRWRAKSRTRCRRAAGSIVEAGTGTGKTFAYLVPALLSGRRVIVSTGTRTLQDQLFHRDLPTVAAAIGRPVRVALLKGRANYLCLHRLDLAEQQAIARGLRTRSRDGVAQGARVVARSRATAISPSWRSSAKPIPCGPG